MAGQMKVGTASSRSALLSMHRNHPPVSRTMVCQKISLMGPFTVALQGGQNHLLDMPPLAGNVEVLLRSIDLITTARPKALLWQARVTAAPNASNTEAGGTTNTIQRVISRMTPPTRCAQWVATSPPNSYRTERL